MQISAIPPLPPTTPPEHAATDPKTAAKAPETAAHTAAEDDAKKVFTPAPPLRPNVQDVVDIDRALIALRAL